MPASCLPQGRWPGCGTPGFLVEDSKGLDGTVIHSFCLVPPTPIPRAPPPPNQRPPPAGSVHISRSQGLNLGPATVWEAQVFLPLPLWGRGPGCAKPQAEVWGRGRDQQDSSNVSTASTLRCPQSQRYPKGVGSSSMGMGGGTKEQSDCC